MFRHINQYKQCHKQLMKLQQPEKVQALKLAQLTTISTILSQSELETAIQRAKPINLQERTSLYDKYLYFVLTGAVDISLHINDQIHKLTYTPGHTFRIFRGETRKSITWIKGTHILPLTPFILEEIDKSPSLQFLSGSSKQYLSSVAEQREIPYKSMVIERKATSAFFYIIKSGQFKKTSENNQTILPRGEDFAGEAILNSPCFGIQCLSHQSRILAIPIREIVRMMALLSGETRSKMQHFLTFKRDMFENTLRKKRQSLDISIPEKKIFERSRVVEGERRSNEILPPILANSHLLLRVKIHKPILRGRLSSFSSKTTS